MCCFWLARQRQWYHPWAVAQLSTRKNPERGEFVTSPTGRRSEKCWKHCIDRSVLPQSASVIVTVSVGDKFQVETIYNTPRTEKEECQFDLSITTTERVQRMHDQPILVAPKPTEASKKKKLKAKKPKCRRKDGKKCKRRRCKGRRCKGKKKQRGGRRNKPQPTTPAPQRSTRPPQNDGPAPNSVSIKICTK